MNAGDTVTIKRNLRHRAINVGDKPAVMIVVFSSPERQTIVEEETCAPMEARRVSEGAP